MLGEPLERLSQDRDRFESHPWIAEQLTQRITMALPVRGLLNYICALDTASDFVIRNPSDIRQSSFSQRGNS
jgi:hypothetical protein